MVRPFSLALPLLAGVLVLHTSLAAAAETLPPLSEDLTVVATFESAGLRFNHSQGHCDPVCDSVSVSYRQDGETAWRDAIEMMYDPTTFTGKPNFGQYRSSIVGLAPDTEYEVKVTIAGSTDHYQRFSTWQETEDWPIAYTTIASGATSVTFSGTPDGYHLVDGSAVTVKGGNRCVRVDASYVIVRGFDCVDQTHTPVKIQDGVTDVLIEDMNIHGWTGSKKGAITIGNNDDHTETRRIVIQNNHIHDPGWGLSTHKWGSSSPYAVMVREEHGGNHVIRHNTFTASREHMWRDAIGGFRNDSEWGAPGADTDIYGNYISHCGDDCIEVEGGGENVRVWGNFLHEYGVAIAVAGVAKGPVYIFRNVGGRADGLARGDGLQSGAIKVTTKPMKRCADCGERHGRHYVFHNTFPNTLGADGSRLQAGNHWGGHPRAQTVVNTIFETHRRGFDDGGCFYGDQANAYSHNLYWQSAVLSACGLMTAGIRAQPDFDAGFTPTPGTGEAAWFALKAGAPGHDAGMVIPNFSDGYHGAAPDMGAHETGSGPMCFGHACATDFGDAPAGTAAAPNSYPTRRANNGAAHAARGLMLGALRDADTDGRPSAMADGDDDHRVDDEDGVSFGTLKAGRSGQATVTVSGTGRLDAWVDFNADGDWADAGEQVFTSHAVYTGSNALAMTVPAGAHIGSTFARFRLSTTGGLAPSGFAPDGEVEDYRVAIKAATAQPPAQLALARLVSQLRKWVKSVREQRTERRSNRRAWQRF